MQQQKKESNKLQIRDNNWQDTVSFVRHQVEGGKTKGIIQKVELDDSTASVLIRPRSMERSVNCELDATIRTDQTSEFEKFLKSYGYEPTEKDVLTQIEGEECQLNVETTKNNDLKFYLPKDKLGSAEEEQTSRKRIKQNVLSLVFGYITGTIPVANFVILYSKNIEALKPKQQETTYDNTDLFFIVGIATSVLILYGVLIPLFYIY